MIGHIGDIEWLEPGETVTLTAAFRLGAAGVTNVGIARGSDQLGTSVEDGDTAEVTVVLGETVTPPGGPGAGGPLGGLAITGSSIVLKLAIAAFHVPLHWVKVWRLDREKGKPPMEGFEIHLQRGPALLAARGPSQFVHRADRRGRAA